MSTDTKLFVIGGMLALGLLSPLPAFSQSYSFKILGGNLQPNGINDKGVVVGQCCAPIQGFIVANGTVTNVIDPLDPTGNTILYGINNDGVIVGTSDTRSFWLKDGVFHTITDATSSVMLQPEGINSKGAFAGWLTTKSGLFGFVYASKKITPLASPVTSINDSQDVVGTVLNSDVGYEILGGVYSILSVPSSNYTYPAGINDRKTISGWYSDLNNYAHGFVLRNGAVTTIDYPGADFTRLGGINRFGQVVGFAIANGAVTGFEATPMP